MKKLFVMAIAAVMSLGASAQLISSNTMTHKASKNYSRLSISYNSLSFDKDFKDVDGISGLSLAWTKGISISQTTPLFVETGLGVTYAWGSEEESESDYGITATEEVKHSFLNLTVPVNLVYKYEIPNSGVTLAPYVGIYLRGNILAKTEDEYTVSGQGYNDSDSEETNWFDAIDDNEPGYGANRFSIGWNIGVGVEWSKLYVGIAYGSDFNKYVDIDESGVKANTKISTFSATVGFNF